MRLVIDDARHAEAASARLGEWLKRVELAASRFRTDSQLSLANSRAGRPVAVSRLLVDMVAAALDAAQLVKVLTGVFDPPPTALSVPWGYLAVTIVLVVGTLVLVTMGAVRIARRPAIGVLGRL